MNLNDLRREFNKGVLFCEDYKVEDIKANFDTIMYIRWLEEKILEYENKM